MLLLCRSAVVPVWILLVSAAASAQNLDAIHQEMREALAEVSHEYFTTGRNPIDQSAPRVSSVAPLPDPWMLIVGFTGGLEAKDSRASGVVEINQQLARHFKEQGGGALSLTYNNFRWRQALTDVLRAVRQYRADSRSSPRIRQPMIVAHGHSWGAGSVTKLARALDSHGIEISLAIYVDAFQFRNPRLPDNIRYAVNFYQRAGLLGGLPIRGKKKLIPENPEKTKVLGSYEIDPQTERWGWSWNPFQPLFYRQHHRIAHDVRLAGFLLEITSMNFAALRRAYTLAATLPPPGLFERVVIVGASVSASQASRSPGWLLARHLGTLEQNIFVFAEGGSGSKAHYRELERIARLKPSLIIAVDLFYHDFKMSLFLSESRKEYLRRYISRLHDTGAVVVLGNIPSLVLLRHEHVNRFLSELVPQFPNVVLVDTRNLLDALTGKGLLISTDGGDVLLRKEDVFVDREHLNHLGSTVLANLILQRLTARFPDRFWQPVKPIDVRRHANSAASGPAPTAEGLKSSP